MFFHIIDWFNHRANPDQHAATPRQHPATRIPGSHRDSYAHWNFLVNFQNI